ncbi:hypothetical protein cgp_4009 [Corynebacterium glutamicum MB001]|nr:hypothetical protein cgp_4009 [Corynebacterium glutamicum MB001]ASW13145.1 hypothetical protein cgc1_4009 [Corynebacterium glutamicum]QYO72607.1 hypothetical protein cgisf_4009 [Corynebacterium glutamicum]
MMAKDQLDIVKDAVFH